jgi:hypothetical protein
MIGQSRIHRQRRETNVHAVEESHCIQDKSRGMMRFRSLRIALVEMSPATTVFPTDMSTFTSVISSIGGWHLFGEDVDAQFQESAVTIPPHQSSDS